MQRGWTVGRARSNACRVRSKRRNSAESAEQLYTDAAFACHLRHLLSPHPYHTLRRKLEAGTPLPMSLRAFAAARAAEGRSARAGRDLQQRRLPLYVCYYYPLEAVDLVLLACLRRLRAYERGRGVTGCSTSTRVCVPLGTLTLVACARVCFLSLLGEGVGTRCCCGGEPGSRLIVRSFVRSTRVRT